MGGQGVGLRFRRRGRGAACGVLCVVPYHSYPPPPTELVCADVLSLVIPKRHSRPCAFTTTTVSPPGWLPLRVPPPPPLAPTLVCRGALTIYLLVATTTCTLGS